MDRRLRLAVAEGDGIGREVVPQAIRVLRSALEAYGETEVELVGVPVGWVSVERFGRPLTDAVLETIAGCDALVLGPLEVGSYPGTLEETVSPSGRIRRHFDLYANIRPSRSRGRNICGKEVDIVIVRENTEDFYADRNMFRGSGEFMPTPDVAMSLRVITRAKSQKISEVAFRYAMGRRKKVTAVHKGNVLRMTDGLFLQAFRQVASRYPEVKAEDRIVDSTAYDMVLHPEKFDVIVTTNMFGDILSDEAAALSGTLGLAPSINAGDSFAMAQAVHGSAPDIAGKGISNPISEILSVSMLMSWLSERKGLRDLEKVAWAIDGAVDRVLRSPEDLTPDLGGRGTTVSLADSIIAEMR